MFGKPRLSSAKEDSIMKKLLLIVAVTLLLWGDRSPLHAQLFRVLVTNDDGVSAPGIAALVEQLTRNPNFDITVIAPATNKSRTGDKITSTGSIEVTKAKTAEGFEATAVAGFPADTILFGVLKQLPEPPDVVVSGVNYGPNFTNMIKVSGTVGAALTAARLGIPAIAVSQGFGSEFSSPLNYDSAAIFVANVVEMLRTNRDFQKKMMSSNGLNQHLVLNINFPSCLDGNLRGVKVVPLARFTRIVDYTLIAEDGPIRKYKPVLDRKDYVKRTDCGSTLSDPLTDYDALMNGFATVTPLNPDLTVDSSLTSFKFLEQIDFKESVKRIQSEQGLSD
jgi:5'-nucleotidase